ncbi:MAG: hypothetical protein OXI15_02140 [Chromatiales bacterium]|nr:hypothetical protein [Chromatiales bacterium]
MPTIHLQGNRVIDHAGRDIGRLRRRRRRRGIGGRPHNYVLQSGAAQASLAWTRDEALASLAHATRMAQARHVPTHTLIFHVTDPRPAAPKTPREPLRTRYLRAFTAHAAHADRRTAMRRAVADTIAEHLADEHGAGRHSDTGDPPDYHAWRLLAGLDQPWRAIEPLLRLYLRLRP